MGNNGGSHRVLVLHHLQPNTCGTPWGTDMKSGIERMKGSSSLQVRLLTSQNVVRGELD